ncbi:MAG: hypothetical protein ACYDGM_03130 [Vulcanimicrobiaceae bacterium]
MVRFLLLALVLGSCAIGVARADTASARLPRSYFGVQGLVIAGQHRDVAGTQHGIGGAPLLEARAGSKRIAIHLEGIPVVSAPQPASAFYGQATPAVGIFNGEIEAALDARDSVWLGIGNTIINQRTPLPTILQVVSSRLAGVRYTLRAREATHSPGHFIEAYFGVAPNLSGVDHFLYSDGVTAPVNKDERASELDASLAFGWHREHTEWLIGLRALNFTARFTATGEAADRNVGIGPMIEWRHLLRP